jgi:hypothetical protein
MQLPFNITTRGLLVFDFNFMLAKPDCSNFISIPNPDNSEYVDEDCGVEEKSWQREVHTHST